MRVSIEEEEKKRDRLDFFDGLDFRTIPFLVLFKDHP